MQRLTVVESDGIGLVVQGSLLSVGLVLSDAKRHRETLAWFLGAEGDWVGVDPNVPWEASELHDHA